MTKKLHRFLIPTVPTEKSWTLTEPSVIHQIIHVLKLRAGEECIVFADGTTETKVRITSVEKHSVGLETITTQPVVQPTRKLIAAVAIVKKDTFETIVQKLTELGVAEIVPIITTRTIKQSLRLDRLQLISDEALEQSGGTRRVVIRQPQQLVTTLEKYPLRSIVFEIGAPQLHSFDDTTIVMYIGPEGGWGEEDKGVFAKHDISYATLGQRTLRAETAAIAGAYELLK